jgi:oxygen-independent coproporphyrinogen-3 oxidase
MSSNFLRRKISWFFTGKNEYTLSNQVPSYEQIGEKFLTIDELGLYIHIPFCNQICPYCPYNKEIFTEVTCRQYIEAIKKEIEIYSSIVGKKPITTFYIGGGTPTTMLNHGIGDIINHIYKHFNMQCSPHMESHPNHLSENNLNTIESLGVKYLSIGVEALQDRHLKAICRPYTVYEMKKSVGRAVSRNFECVNIDYIFDLPNQTVSETEQAAIEMVNMGVNQVATYPLFRFPYTKLGYEFHKNRKAIPTMFRRRKFLKVMENIFYENDFVRTSVWAFTKKGTKKYCSVTVPLYLGLGASGTSYLNDIFYVNTFNVASYINAIKQGKTPIALSLNLTKRMQMAGWLYWRIYEAKFRKSDFKTRFGLDFDLKYGKLFSILQQIGFAKNKDEFVFLTDRGTYWIHALEDFFSIDYISKLWGTAQKVPWPEKVII